MSQQPTSVEQARVALRFAMSPADNIKALGYARQVSQFIMDLVKEDREMHLKILYATLNFTANIFENYDTLLQDAVIENNWQNVLTKSQELGIDKRVQSNVELADKAFHDQLTAQTPKDAKKPAQEEGEKVEGDKAAVEEAPSSSTAPVEEPKA